MTFSAYACGKKAGLILENSFTMDEILLEWPRKLDIIAEKQLVEQKLNHLQTTCANEGDVTAHLNDFGMERFEYRLVKFHLQRVIVTDKSS